jgi:hypothetical protein
LPPFFPFILFFPSLPQSGRLLSLLSSRQADRDETNENPIEIPRARRRAISTPAIASARELSPRSVFSRLLRFHRVRSNCKPFLFFSNETALYLMTFTAQRDHPLFSLTWFPRAFVNPFDKASFDHFIFIVSN